MLQCSSAEPEEREHPVTRDAVRLGLARETYIVGAMYVGGGSSLARPSLDLRKDRASCN